MLFGTFRSINGIPDIKTGIAGSVLTVQALWVILSLMRHGRVIMFCRSSTLKIPKWSRYLLDTVSYWIREFDIDGIRLDCANVLDFDFMKSLRLHCDSVREDFWLMGEVIHGIYSNWANPQMLHSVTNYELHKGLYSGHNDYNCFEIAHTIRRQVNETSRGLDLYTFLDNHDEDRIMSKLKNRHHIYTAYTMLFTLPGIPSVYYGSEWGMEGMRSSTSDDSLRPWR